MLNRSDVKVNGKALRDIGVVNSDGGTVRDAIDGASDLLKS